MTPTGYTKDALVEQPDIELLAELDITVTEETEA